MATKSFRSALRSRILKLEPEQWIPLNKPCTIMYQGYCDEIAHPVKITMVGRYSSRGQCKLHDELGQLFGLPEATEAECEAIFAALPAL